MQLSPQGPRSGSREESREKGAGVRILVLSCTLVAALHGICQAQTPSHHELAAHWAPVIRQATAHPKADFVTRFDYDGNTNGADNWNNLDSHPLSAHVYYSVVETTTHWYLTYALFHPRDYDRIDNPLTSHENDLEGVLLMVARGGAPMGELVLMETVSHFDFYQYSNSASVYEGAEDLDGRISCESHRPILQVESRGHGIKAWDANESVEGTGVVYRYGGRAEVPENQNDPDCSYDLVSIRDTLWAWRFEVGPAQAYGKSGDYPGGHFGYAFNGARYGKHKANAPWGWDDHNDDSPKGEIFLDPARMVSTHMRFETAPAVEYTHNPFLTGEDPAACSARDLGRQELFAAVYPD